MRMCHVWANDSGSGRSASSASERKLLLGCGAAPFGLCLEPLVRPQLFAAVEESEHEVVLRREVAVERRPGDGRTLDHLASLGGGTHAEVRLNARATSR